MVKNIIILKIQSGSITLIDDGFGNLIDCSQYITAASESINYISQSIFAMNFTDMYNQHNKKMFGKPGIYLTCHACDKITCVLESCENCGAEADQFVFGSSKTQGKGIFCKDCGLGATTFLCRHCCKTNAAIEKLVEIW